MNSLTVSSLSSSPGSELSTDEMKLLAKLEEQNRLLETDSKSLYSVNGVLRNPTSPKTFSLEENIWEHVINEWEDWSKRKVGQIKEQLPELHSHFQTQGFQTSVFSSSWIHSIFLSSLPITAAMRIFDIFMCEGLEIIFRVGLAVLHMKQTELIKLDNEEMMNCLQNLESWESNPDSMIEAAYQIKYNGSQMKQFRKDYETIKAKELEEQEELNGLCSENKFLKQRLAILEKRCSEKLVSQLKKELEKTQLNIASSQNALKEMQANISQLEKITDTPDEDSVMYLQMELISCRLREAEALTELKQLKKHIKDMDEKWQQVQCGGQQRVSSAQNDLQVELLSNRLKETLAQATLKESRHTLIQLQTQNEIHRNQLKRTEAHVSSQRDRLQELTSHNKDLHSQLQQSRRCFLAVQNKIQTFSKCPPSSCQPSTSASLEHKGT